MVLFRAKHFLIMLDADRHVMNAAIKHRARLLKLASEVKGEVEEQLPASGTKGMS